MSTVITLFIIARRHVLPIDALPIGGVTALSPSLLAALINVVVVVVVVADVVVVAAVAAYAAVSVCVWLIFSTMQLFLYFITMPKL